MRCLLLGTLVLTVGPIVLAAPMVGVLSDPWAAWRFAERSPLGIDVGGPAAVVDVPPVAHGFVDDRQRYLLARAAGFDAQEAVTATAVSIAEDGSGDPAALSGTNSNGTRDFCLMQVNSRWWARFGGMLALADPLTCFKAAFVIRGIQGWCAWSTYLASCGTGHTGTFAMFLLRAQAAARRVIGGQA